MKTLKYLLGVCAVSLCFIAQNRDDPERIAAQASLIYTPYFFQQTECLAKAIYYEAQGEPYVGKKAVAQVIFNRTKAEGFPTTICGVVNERTGDLCQFSWVCNMPSIKMDPEIWIQSWNLAKSLIAYPQDLYELKDALFFHAKYVEPEWNNLKRVATIGQHVFYSKKPTNANIR